MNWKFTDAEGIMNTVTDFATTYGLKIVGAILVLIFGLWIIKGLTRSLDRMTEKRELDPSLRPFLRTLFNITLKVLLFISILGMLGIQMTSFIAILGALGFAFGLALSGALQNFAYGVMILIFKPFKVGDFVEAAGHMGSVKEITIFNTILNTVDNKVIIIPNGQLASNSITNFSKEPTRRVDFSFGIAYGDSYDKAKEVLEGMINEDTRILKDPAHFIGLGELGDSSVNITVRVWVNSADYWGVFFDMNQSVYKVFAEKGLSIPFPQMDVHLFNEKK